MCSRGDKFGTAGSVNERDDHIAVARTVKQNLSCRGEASSMAANYRKNHRIHNRCRPVHRIFSFPKNSDLALEFHGSSCLWSFLMFWRGQGLFEAAINLAQFPEDQNKENRDHEQQELDVHF
jgi:hypothetical protein